MKKSLFLMALAGVTMTSCVSDEIADVVQNELEKGVKVKFDTPVLYNNVNTRANVYGEIGQNQILKNYPTNERFVVYAVEYDKNTPFTAWDAQGVKAAEFSGQPVSYAGESIDGWAPTYTTTNEETGEVTTHYYYWTAGKQMAFSAYSPAELEQQDIDVSYSDEGLEIKNYKTPQVGSQYDLLFSQRVVDKNSADMLSNAADYSGIKLQFQHALASVRFSFMNHTQTKVCLKKVEIRSVKNQGSFKENITKNSGNKYTRNDNVNPYWSLTESTANYLAFEGTLDFPYNPRYISDLAYTKNEKNEAVLAQGVTACNQLLLLPQDLSELDEEVNNIELYVEYTVGENNALNYKTVSLNNRMSIEGENEANPAVLVNKWEMGHRYTYRIVYSPESASQDMIYFSPSTDQFKDVNVVVVELI